MVSIGWEHKEVLGQPWPHCRLVIFGSGGRGPVTKLTSACNRALLQFGRVHFTGNGSCGSSDLSVQQDTIAGRSFSDRQKRGPVTALTSACNKAQWQSICVRMP